jgi:hypothetical protein
MYALLLAKNGLGNVLGDVFAYASGHPAHRQRLPSAKSPNKFITIPFYAFYMQNLTQKC